MASMGLWVTVSLIILVLVGGFFLFNSTFNSSDEFGDPGIVVVDKSDSQDTSSSQEEPSSEETSTEVPEQIPTPTETTEEVPETKEFNVIAKQWDFSPSTITVNEGDSVILNIKSIDVTHGFAIPEFGVSEQLVSGNNVKIEFTADKKGTFSFFCNVFCGSGHGGMRGTLVVQ